MSARAATIDGSTLTKQELGARISDMIKRKGRLDVKDFEQFGKLEYKQNNSFWARLGRTVTGIPDRVLSTGERVLSIGDKVLGIGDSALGALDTLLSHPMYILLALGGFVVVISYLKR